MSSAQLLEREPEAADDLTRAVLELKAGEHLCLIYEEDPAEQVPAMVPFLKQGLAQGERVVYVADDATTDQVRGWLEASEVDTEREIRRGSLLLWTRELWRQPGELNSSSKAEQVRGFLRDSKAAGYPAIRFGVEMTWTLGPDIDAGKLCHWESTINTLFDEENPGRIICQYNKHRLAPSVIRAALSSHPTAVLGTDVCPNPFYEAPFVLGHSIEDARLDWMIGQLRRAKEAERERDRRIRAEARADELERTRQQLDQALRAATETATALAAANSAKDEFLGLVSHELRTPLTTLKGTANVVRRHIDTLAPADRDLALLDLERGADQLQRIVENMLTLARADSEPEPTTEPLLLRRVIQSTITDQQERSPSRRIDLNVPDELIPLLGHEPWIRQILDNLLSNAAKYSAAGSPIDVTLERRGTYAVISVSDRGIGISDEEIDSVFEPFFRSPEQTGTIGGVGLGLTVCKRLVQRQGGEISAHPRAGGGTTFTFALPVAPEVCENNSTTTG